MSRRRVAWLVLGLVLLVAAALGWKPLLCSRRQRVHQTTIVLRFYDGYYWRWAPDKQAEPDFPQFWCQWDVTLRIGRQGRSAQFRPEGTAVAITVSQSGPPFAPYNIYTAYDMDGSVISQSGEDEEAVRAAPWPYAVPSATGEMKQRLMKAKLFVQAAAQRGEVTLPPDWKYAE